MFNCLAIDIGAGSGRIMRCTIANDEKIDLTEIARFPNESRMVDGRLRWDIDKLVADIKAGLAKAASEMKPDAVERAYENRFAETGFNKSNLFYSRNIVKHTA